MLADTFYAFSGIISRDQHDLELLVRRIAEKCLGSPLAAKSIGVLLSGTNGQIEQWESILSDMQFLEHDRNTDTIVATLQISYQHLPYHLKQCLPFVQCFLLVMNLRRMRWSNCGLLMVLLTAMVGDQLRW